MLSRILSRLGFAVLVAVTAEVSKPTASPQQLSGRAGTIAIVSKSAGALTVVDLAGQRTRQIKVGYLPHEVAAAGSLVFVSNYGSAHVRSSDLTNVPGNTVSVIDLSRREDAAQTIDFGPGRCAPHGLAVSRDRRQIFITCEGRQEVLVLDVTSRRLLHAIATNQAGSHMLVLSGDGARAYVTNFWHGTMSVLDLRAKRILAQIETGSGTEGIGLSPDDRYAYTSSVYINEIVKIDTGTLKVAARARMPNCLGAVRVVPTPVEGRTLVVNCADNNRVLLVAADTLTVTHEIPVGKQPIGIAVPEERVAYVANMLDGTISVIDISRGVVSRTIPAGDDPDGIVFLPNVLPN